MPTEPRDKGPKRTQRGHSRRTRGRPLAALAALGVPDGVRRRTHAFSTRPGGRFWRSRPRRAAPSRNAAAEAVGQHRSSRSPSPRGPEGGPAPGTRRRDSAASGGAAQKRERYAAPCCGPERPPRVTFPPPPRAAAVPDCCSPPAAPSSGRPGMAQHPAARRGTGKGAEERPQGARSQEGRGAEQSAPRPPLSAARFPRACHLPFYHRRFNQLHRPAPPPPPLPLRPAPPAQARSGPAGAAYQRPRCGERNAELGAARPRPCRQRYGRNGDYNSSRAPLPARGGNGSVLQLSARPDYASRAALRLKAPRRRSVPGAGRRGGRCGPSEAVGAALSLHAAVASRPLPAPLRPSLPRVSVVGVDGRAVASFPSWPPPPYRGAQGGGSRLLLAAPFPPCASPSRSQVGARKGWARGLGVTAVCLRAGNRPPRDGCEGSFFYVDVTTPGRWARP